MGDIASAKAASAEVVEFVREGFECWNGYALDEMADMYHPDAEFDASEVFIGSEVVRGRADLRRYWDELWHTWEGIRMDPLEVIEADAEHYVVPVRLWGRGRASGAEVDQRFAFLYTVRDRQIARAQLFADRESALAAALPT